MTFSRRTFSKALLSSIPLAAGASAVLLRSSFLKALAPVASSTYKGIRLGTISFSFKELKRIVGEAQWQEVLQDCQQCGLSNLEIEIAKVEPIRTKRTHGTLDLAFPQFGQASCPRLLQLDHR